MEGRTADNAFDRPTEFFALDRPLVVSDPALPSADESRVYLALKRVADLLIGTLALIPALPTMAVAAVMIYVEDRGPVVYRQSRVGRGGKPFKFLKLRSMHMNADKVWHQMREQSDGDGVIFKMKEDPRITRVGRIIRKLSIDELPQLFLVMKGDMSIVGPRPHLPSEVECYRPEQRMRLSVKPGLLCYREIRGRSHLNFEEWVALDLEYIRDRSLWTDLKIVVLAIPAVFTGRGAF